MKVNDLDTTTLTPGELELYHTFRKWYQDNRLDWKDPELIAFMAYLEGSRDALLKIRPIFYPHEPS